MTVHFDDREVEIIQRMAEVGLPMKHIARIIGCSPDTIERRAKVDPRIETALGRGRANAASEVYRSCYEMAVSRKHPVVTIFWLKCMEGWKDGNQDENLKEAVKATSENVAKLYEIARKGNAERSVG